MRGRRDAMILVMAMGIALVADPGQLLAGSDSDRLIQRLDEVPEELLLDVGIRLLDPGLDDEEDTDELEKLGIFPYLRRSEARWIPFQLRTTLERSGFWGAVRVIPDDQASVDLSVEGEIIKSTGKDLVLRIRAVDSRGRAWIKGRKYEAEADSRVYESGSDEEIVDAAEPYQTMYNRIANDLQRDLKKLDEDEIATIRWVTQLKFAEDVAPDAFSG